MKKVIIVISFIILVGIIFCTQFTLASASATAKLASNKTTISKGDKIEITLSLSDFKEIGNGINAYTCTLSFDKDLFEFEKAEGLNNWNSPTYNSKNVVAGSTKLAATINNFTTSEGSVLKITLKAKDNLTKETTVSITGLEVATKVNGVTSKISVNDSQVKISTKNQNGGTQIYEGNNSQYKVIGNSDDVVELKGVDSTTSKTGIAYAGKEQILFVLIILTIISSFLYIKIKQYKDIS